MPLIMQTAFDVVFLDIEMPELNGLELAEQISCLDHPPKIIFVTAYNEYALKAFKVDALDYLVKPVGDEELSRVIKKLKKSIAKHKHKQNENNFENEGKHIIRAKMLAKLKYYQLDKEIDIDFPTAKCEELFIYMVLKGNESVSKWKLIEDIWIGKNAEKGEISIRTTVFRINKALSEAGLAVKIRAEKSNYRVSDHIDIIDLEKL